MKPTSDEEAGWQQRRKEREAFRQTLEAPGDTTPKQMDLNAERTVFYPEQVAAAEKQRFKDGDAAATKKRERNKMGSPREKHMAITGFQSDKKLDREADSNFEKLVLKRMELYRCDALDALHDLAMMPVSDNSSMNNIKFLACCCLAGAPRESDAGGADIHHVLQNLNDSYHSAAKRIKSIRERTITFEDSPIVIESPPLPAQQ